MIRRLTLRGWKAFDALDLELHDGVTFVVARNGVGKTSIVEAASWGVFGAISGIDGRASRRAGYDEARVTVEIELPDGQTLLLDRRLAVDETTHHRLNGIDISDEEASKTLAAAMGASSAFLSRATILPSSLMVDERSSSGYLRDHLAVVFGVAQLEAAAVQLEQVRDQAGEAAAGFRKSARSVSRNIASLKQELITAQTAEEAAQQGRDVLEERARQAQEHLIATTRAAEKAEGAAAAATAFREFASNAATALGGRLTAVTGEPELLLRTLSELEVSTASQADQHRQTIASLTGRLEVVTGSARQLATADAICPVCRRTMTKEVAARAEHAHAQEISALEAERAEAEASLERVHQFLADVRRLRATAPSVPRPVPDGAPSFSDLDAARDAHESARDELMAFVERLGAARATRAQLAGHLADAEQQDVDAAASLREHQREAAAAIAVDSMRATAKAILQERIDPLVAEVRNRWKKVHADRGSLTLLPDGRMVLVRGEHTIEFAQFSSGEKVIALLEARMIVLAASTRASFLWLDEPMEHLDPISRRAVASLLATGTAGQGIRQIVVTTYEEELARTFAVSEDAQLIWVDATEGNGRPK